MAIKEFTPLIQTKLWQYTHSFIREYTKAEHKFIHQMIFGILKSGQVQLNEIGRSLQEGISLKKVCKRLSVHLSKENFWFRVIMSLLKTQSHRLKGCHYLIFDLCDIQKHYAKKMEGLSKVRDGSTKQDGYGYYQSNMMGVSEDGATIIPLYSELYSHRIETDGENGKIISAIDTVMPYARKDAIIVIDRGADRGILYKAFLQAGYHFIIRQNGNRNLYYNGETKLLKTISRSVKLKWTYKAERIKNNKIQHLVYKGGAVQVQLSEEGPLLWLVVTKENKRGYTWYLLHLPSCTQAKQAVDTVIKGYGLRWKIEEVHRQIKTDYNLESVCLQRYQALKTINALLWMAVSFLYTRLEQMALEIIFEPELALVNRKKMKELLRFIYYKLALAVKRILSLAKSRYTIITKKESINQLKLGFLHSP